MVDKLASYTGGLHIFKNYLKEKWGTVKEKGAIGTVHELKSLTGQKVEYLKEKAVKILNHGLDDFSHIYRRKTRSEMVRISAAVMGIEFCYAAETAFVSPTLLKIGVRHRQMTLIWCLSPFIGFFLTPILGSLSDKCRSPLGRRRPFIILLSLGIILGLILVPNGKIIGEALGDVWPKNSLQPPQNFSDFWQKNSSEEERDAILGLGEETSDLQFQTDEELDKKAEYYIPYKNYEKDNSYEAHPWGIFFTILGTMLLDFDADACQSPSRAYLLDITVPEDHATGLSTFTIMAGLGGGLGYAMGAINWDVTFVGQMFGGHVKAVFTLVTFIYIGCVCCTLSSFREIPLDVLLETERRCKEEMQKSEDTKNTEIEAGKAMDYGTINNANGQPSHPASSPSAYQETSLGVDCTKNAQQGPTLGDFDRNLEVDEGQEEISRATLKQYLLSILYMPKSLRTLCLTNLFCWMSLVCYSLYFTDFVGEAVFGGDPKALEGTRKRELYEDGVRFGCWGMALYSLSCSTYSFLIEKLVRTFRARPVYIYGQLVYSIGMVFMAAFRHHVAVIIFSCCAGVMYSTLFTMPYLLVAHYHASGTLQCEDVWIVTKIRQILARGFSSKPSEEEKIPEYGPENQIRGLGTDVAIISSMVFLAQFILSACMGTIISIVGSTTAVVCVASILAFCGAITATQVTYLDL